jgi:hypothetical protein
MVFSGVSCSIFIDTHQLNSFTACSALWKHECAAHPLYISLLLSAVTGMNADYLSNRNKDVDILILREDEMGGACSTNGSDEKRIRSSGWII